MATVILDEAMINDVVQHMNEDHNDACLAIVQALGGVPEAKSATMLTMDTVAVEFVAQSSDGSEQRVRVLFDKPIRQDKQIRGHLVSMTRRARAALG